MSEMNRCPTLDDLHRFLLGKVEDGIAAQVQDHLSFCGSCLDTVAHLKTEDTLVAAVRAQARATTEPDEAVVEGLMDRLSGLHRQLVDATSEMPQSESTTGTQARLEFLTPPQESGELGRLGKYRVLKVLGAGGMGIVFEAEDTSLRRRVALKVMKPSLTQHAVHRQRFLREAQATAAIEHDHIVTIHQVGEDRGVLYLAQQLLKGETLEDRVKRETMLAPPDVLRIGREIAEGLSAAHAHGLVHRDIKPSNIWLEGRGGRVKVLDFGLARPADDDAHLTQTGTLTGTPQYMAPEQASGQVVDHRCDLFTLGCVLYRMTTGRLPFEGPNTLAVLRALAVEQPPPAHEVNTAVPPALSELITRLLEKSPARRPQSAQDVVAAIARIEKELPSDAAQKRRVRRIALAAAVLLTSTSGFMAAFGPGTVYRFTTNQGQLVIESVDPDVEITATGGGQQIKISDLKSGRHVTIKAGKYELELTGKEGLTLSTTAFTLDRGGQQIVKVTYKPADIERSLPSENVAEVEQPSGAEPPGEVACFRDLPRFPTSLTFSPDGKQAWMGSGHVYRDGQWVADPAEFLSLGYDVAARQERYQLRGHNSSIIGVAVSEDGGVYSCAWGGQVLKWDAGSGKLLERYQGPPGSGGAAAFATERGWALFGGEDGFTQLWDLERSRAITTFKGHSQFVKSVAISPDRKRALSGGGGGADGKPGPNPDYSIRLWDLADGKELHSLRGHTNGVAHVLFAPDGRTAFSDSWDGTIREWDLETGKQRRWIFGVLNPSIALSGDGRLLIVGAADGSVRLWDVERWEEVQRFTGHNLGIYCVAISPDGKYGLSGSYDHTVRLWRLPDSNRIVPPGERPFVVLAPDDRPERAYASLSAAALVAEEGGAIEIRGNGPFVTPAINLSHRGLVIRAGAGFEPVLEIDAKSLEANAPLLTSYGLLVLEGLHFRHVEQGPTKKDWYQFLVCAGPFSATHCRFFIKSHREANSLYLDKSPRVQLQHCEFGGTFRTAVQWANLDSSHRLEMTDCLCWGAKYLVGYHQPREIAMRLERNTFVGDTAIIQFYQQLPEPPASADQRPFRIEARQNVFHAGRLLTANMLPPGKFEPDAGQALLPRTLAWTESQNLYTGVMLTLADWGTGKSQHRLQTLQEWQDYWGLKDTGSLKQNPGYQGGDVRTEMAASPETLTATDFRLHPDSAGKGAGANGRDLGADVSLVGPGPAYDDWKRTPAYLDWLQHSGQRP